MIAIGMKQVPVCRKHHLELHRYNWTNKPIKLPMKQSDVGEPCDG